MQEDWLPSLLKERHPQDRTTLKHPSCFEHLHLVNLLRRLPLLLLKEQLGAQKLPYRFSLFATLS
jgi:hypothetical protein